MWDSLLMLKRNLDNSMGIHYSHLFPFSFSFFFFLINIISIGALSAFQQEYEKMEMLLGQMRFKYRRHAEEVKERERRFQDDEKKRLLRKGRV